MGASGIRSAGMRLPGGVALAGAVGALALASAGWLEGVTVGAVLLALWAACRLWGPPASRQQRLLAAACACYALGEAFWLAAELATGEANPLGGPSDLFYLAFYGLAATSLLGLLRTTSERAMREALPPALMSVAGVAAVGFRLLVYPVLEGPTHPAAEVWPAFGYAGGSLVLVTLALAAVFSRRVEPARANRFAPLLGGMALMAAGDLHYLAETLVGRYQTSFWADGPWLAALALLGLSGTAFRNEARSRESDEAPRVSRSCLIPTLVSALAVAALVALDLHQYGLITSGVAFSALGLVALGTGYRASEIRRQDRLLQETLSAAARNLQSQVEARTRELAGLVSATRSIHDSLNPEAIARTSVEQVRDLLQSDAALLWIPPSPSDAPSEAKATWCHAGLGNQELSALNVVATTPPSEGPVQLQARPDGESATNYLLVPVHLRDHPAGWLGVLRRERPFSQLEQGLAASIAHTVASAMDNARAHQKVLSLAQLDPVTGVLNPRTMHDRLERALAERRPEDSLALLLLDLVNFRQVNAIHGLPAGDAILRRAAQLLTVCIPEGAVAGRFGSDEFLVLLPGVGLQEAANVAEAIAKTLSTYGYSVPNGPFLPIPCHIGVAVAPEDGESVNALLGAANWNLSIAKRNDVTVGLATDSRREDRKFLSDESFAALDALVAAVDNKDSYTRRHSEEVADYCSWLAEELGCSQETLDLVRMAALLHDVGKIGVPTEILTKPGRLTDAEYDTMKRHPVIGGMLIGAFRGMGRILDGAKYHHERWDGTGYPEGLKGNDIPWLGRLIAVADAFSAMTTNRPYRKGFSVSEAVRRLEEAAGTQLDPYMVEAFVRALTRRGLYRVSVRDELRQRRAA